jgi:PAS domain S-box-containing protein
VRSRGAWRIDSGHLAGLRGLLIFESVYYFAYKYAMTSSSQPGAPFWLPDPVLLCALLLARPRMWLVYIGATLPLRLLVDVPPALPLWFLLAAFVNDSLKGLTAAALTRRVLRGRAIRFDSLHVLWAYGFAAVLVAPALSAVGGAAAWAMLGKDFWTTWRHWFLGDAIANLVCTPLLLALVRESRSLAGASAFRYLEALTLFSSLLLTGSFAFREGIGSAGLTNPLVYLPLPFLVWAAVRFGPPGASGALLIMGALCVAAASSHRGLNDSTLFIQIFMLVLAIPIMPLSVLVAEQRRTEVSLRESEERFRNMADNAPVMIWVSGPDQRCTFFNRGWLAFTGRTLDQELGDGWADGVHADDLGRCLEIYSTSFEARRGFQMEYRLRRADGEYRWVLDEGVPRFEQGGVFVGYIGSCIDITDLKNAQAEALARQKFETLGVMTSGIAHDFNNLAGSILANAELAELQLAQGLSPRGEIEGIKAVAIRASQIVRELMIYCGQDKPNREPVDISSLVEDTLKLLKVSISKHASLRTDLDPDLPSVRGSAAQLQQVVMNLIINASEAIGEIDGVIHVATSQVIGEAGADEEAASAAARYVRLEVSDTGCGMPESVRSRIFDPFFSTKFAGRGMGLAVVQGIVRDHGGAITLISEPGRGTTFEIVLPCEGAAADARPAVPTRAAGARTDPGAGAILVVEDEEVLRRAVAALLRKRGSAVIEASDGTEAIALLRAHNSEIAAVLLDVTLPGVSSREVFEEARLLRPSITIVLTSAHSKETVDAAFAGLTVERFIRKPFQMDDLMGMLWEEASG